MLRCTRAWRSIAVEETRHGNAPSTVPSTRRDGTDEPGTLAAEVARGPGDRDALLYGLSALRPRVRPARMTTISACWRMAKLSAASSKPMRWQAASCRRNLDGHRRPVATTYPHCGIVLISSNGVGEAAPITASVCRCHQNLQNGIPESTHPGRTARELHR